MSQLPTTGYELLGAALLNIAGLAGIWIQAHRYVTAAKTRFDTMQGSVTEVQNQVTNGDPKRNLLKEVGQIASAVSGIAEDLRLTRRDLTALSERTEADMQDLRGEVAQIKQRGGPKLWPGFLR